MADHESRETGWSETASASGRRQEHRFGELRYYVPQEILDVTWQGLREDWVCRDPEELIETLRWGLEQRREVDALEFTRGGDRVVLG